MQCILIFLDAMHFNILRQSGRSVYAYFKIYFYMPNFASIGRVDLVVLAANIFHYKTDKSEQSDLPCQNIVVAITGAEEMTESLISGHTPFYCFGSTAAGAAVSRAGFKCV